MARFDITERERELQELLIQKQKVMKKAKAIQIQIDSCKKSIWNYNFRYRQKLEVLKDEK